MPIIVNGKINPIKKEKEVPSIVEPVTKTETPKSKEYKYNFDKEKVYLVINGKVKEISKKSKYLVDMLIIEED